MYHRDEGIVLNTSSNLFKLSIETNQISSNAFLMGSEESMRGSFKIFENNSPIIEISFANAPVPMGPNNKYVFLPFPSVLATADAIIAFNLL